MAILLEEEVAEEVEVEEEEDGSNEEKGEAKIEGEVEEEELGMMITLSIQNSTSHEVRTCVHFNWFLIVLHRIANFDETYIIRTSQFLFLFLHTFLCTICTIIFRSHLNKRRYD